ncbi:MAG: hypothetical protein M0Z31_01480 [Clostridia bacterium]|nr:hypothetical protein [Clostridia bacterium]
MVIKKNQKKIIPTVKKKPSKPPKKVNKPAVKKTPAPEPLQEIILPKVPFFLVVTLMQQVPAPGRTINIFEDGSLLTTGVTDELGIAHFPDIPAPLSKELLVQVIGARGIDAEGVASSGSSFIILDVRQ